MDFQQLFSQILSTVDGEAYFHPVAAVDPAKQAAMEAIQSATADADMPVTSVRALIDRLTERGHIDAVLRLSALHVLACHPRVADYEEAARLVGEQEFVALSLGGPDLNRNLASVDRHRGVLAFIKGHHEVALDYFARALERERTSENVQNVLCTLCAMGELEEAASLLSQVQDNFPPALVVDLNAAIARDPDLASLRPGADHDHH